MDTLEPNGVGDKAREANANKERLILFSCLKEMNK